MTHYYAHSRPYKSPLPENSKEDWDLLREHLERVGEEAARRALCWGHSNEARLAGLLHDMGKYASNFQKRLEGKATGVDHWSVGAFWAAKRRAYVAACAIYGHHVGLVPPATLQALTEKAKDPVGSWNISESPDLIKSAFSGDGLEMPMTRPIDWKALLPQKHRCAMAVRMLFSALCDADFIATEEHFDHYEHERNRPDPPQLQPLKALDIVLQHVGKKPKPSGYQAQEVYGARQTLLRDCLEAAEKDDRLYTLTAPTGAGKTLASLAFALKHAVAHDLRRVIVVIPYLSIIEQTAGELRALFEPVFGPDYVLEHHSMADRTVRREFGDRDQDQDAEEETERRRRLLSENWAAPLIVTTSVQFFESLFANTPTTCRKLHSIAKSVVYFDEAQTLPTSLAVATLEALNALIADYKVTVVFGTATQPAFKTLARSIGGGWQPDEIVRNVPALFSRLRRVAPVWPQSPEEAMDWPEVAARLAERDQALCVVNLKKHAVALTKALQDIVPAEARHTIFHLSTALCPAHRRDVLKEIRVRLDPEDKKQVYLISTQCIEAGVDLDFPVVWRASGPLEALAQAFGRCNREGRLQPGECEARVFIPADGDIPMPAYRQAADVAKTYHWGANLHDADEFTAYFAKLYDTQDLAGEGGQRQRALRDALDKLDFPVIAEQYRLIAHDTVAVVVPYGTEGRALCHALQHPIASLQVLHALLRKAQPYVVNLFRSQLRDPDFSRNLRPVAAMKGGGWLVWTGVYDEKLLGILTELPPDLLVV